MAIEQYHLIDFQRLFTGNKQNYGQHTYKEIGDEDVKEKGISLTITEKLLTTKQYEAHLKGNKGLGIIPIDENNKCSMAIIDVDLYNEDLELYIKAIEVNNFPIVPFLSKSGGLHLYLFLLEPTEVSLVRKTMYRIAEMLSIDMLVKRISNSMVEIFPKQNKLTKGKVGSWINLPYYDSENNIGQRAIVNGQTLTLSEALVYIGTKVISIEDVILFLDELPFKDGPPCLQALYILSPLAHGNRNNYLFSFGVYLKKKDENFFEQTLFEINRALEYPLEDNELENTILASLRRKDYSYRCMESPCVDYCNKKQCKLREYGVGKDGGYFSNLEYGKLTQIKTYEPYYEWQIKLQEEETFKILRFKNEDEIIKQDAFLKLAFRELHILPIKLKNTEWFKKINESLIAIDVVDVNTEDDISKMSLFRTIFFEFLLNRAPAHTRDQVASKRVYFEDEHQTYNFRAKDLIDYLYLSKGFTSFSPTEVHGILRDMKCIQGRLRTETNKQLRVLRISKETIDEQINIVDVPYVADFEKELEEDF